MSQSKKLIPKRRFMEFDGAKEWQKFRLGDHAIIKGRLGWKSLKQEEYVDNGPSMIAGKHITDGQINWNKVDHIPQWRYDESPEIMLKNDDLIFSKDGSLGNPALIENLNGLATINSTMMLVRLKKNISSRFFYQIMLSNQFDSLVRLKVSGSSIPHLFQADMTEFKFNAPILGEQTVVGEFFKKLDNLIQTQQKKLQKAKNLKSSYLAEMFSSDGELKPKLRFDGFSEDWSFVAIAEISEIVRGASPRPIQDKKWFDRNSQIGWLRISDVTEQNGRIYYLEQRLSKAGQEKTRVLYEPHLLLSIAATVGKPVINYVKTGVHDGFLIFLNPKFHPEFMFQYLDMFRPQWQKYGQSGSQINLNSDIVKNHKIALPTIKEQTKIGNFFKLLDQKIALEQRKLDKLNNIKHAYLNEMFV